MKVQRLLDKLLPPRTVHLLTFDCLYLQDFSLILKEEFNCVEENKTKIQSSPLRKFSPSLMATLRNKRKLAAISIETSETTRSGRTQNVLDPELAQEYISQVSEEIEGRVSKKLSKEFSKTESRILGALSKLDEFLLNPQVRTCSVAVPGTSRSSNLENQGTNEDRPSDDPGPEVEFSSPFSGAETDPYMVTGVTRQIRQDPHMTMEAQEEIPYCTTSTSSGKQKKARSTSQPQFRSENTPATLEADQILLALQQLATNSNSANFNNNISRISKLPKSLTTTMPTFDGKSEKFELFEDLFQTSLKIHNQLTEEDKVNYFHSLMRGDALQTFKNITSPNRENLAEILTVFRRKYVKPQSMATAKHKFQRLVFNPANQKLIDFLDELQKLAKDAFGVAAQAIIEQVIYAKMPPHLKKSINQAHLEDGTYEQIVSHLERELELNGLEAPDEMQLNTVMQQYTQQNSENPNQHATIAKSQVTIEISTVNSNERKTKSKTIQIVLQITKTTMVVPKQTLTPNTKHQSHTRLTIQIIKETENLDLSFHPVKHMAEQTTPHRDAALEQMQRTDRLPGTDGRKDKTKPNREILKITRMGMSKL